MNLGAFMMILNVYITQIMKKSKYFQEPYNNYDYYHYIQYGFNFPSMGMYELTSHRRTPAAMRISKTVKIGIILIFKLLDNV